MIILIKEEKNMFTHLMNEEEKSKFLELVYKISNIDDEYAKEEEELINSYKKELEIEVIEDTQSIESLISYFGKKSEEIKRIVLFEIYGLILADDKIEKEEEQILEEIRKDFQFEEQELKEILSVAKRLQVVYDDIYNVIFK